MADVNKIFGIREVRDTLVRPERQSIEQTEDYAVKQVTITKELIVEKLWLDKTTDTYFKYNSTSGELELYVGGVIKATF